MAAALWDRAGLTTSRGETLQLSIVPVNRFNSDDTVPSVKEYTDKCLAFVLAERNLQIVSDRRWIAKT